MRAIHDDAVYLPGETLQIRLSTDFEYATPGDEADRDRFTLRFGDCGDRDPLPPELLAEAARHGFRLGRLPDERLALFVRIGGERAGDKKAAEHDDDALAREHEYERSLYEETNNPSGEGR